MYSVLLLAAMTTCDSAPALHKTGHSAWTGHSGGHWRSTWGSYGACYGGCYGYGYTGWVGVGGWGHPHASAAAGWGEAYGSDVGWGAPFGSYAPASGGKPGCVVPAGVGIGGEAAAVSPRQTQLVTPAGGATQKAVPESARLVVNLPEGAKLFVDDTEIQRPGTSRNFRTPGLQVGEKYYYDLRAQVTRDGRVVTEKRRVVLGAGQTVNADFRGLGAPAGVATAGSR